MLDDRLPHALIELLEPRIAPALAVINPLFDLMVGPGKTGADVDLSRLFDPAVSGAGHTIVTLTTNFDADLDTPGIQESAPIVIELLDDEAPALGAEFSELSRFGIRRDVLPPRWHELRRARRGFKAATPDTHIPTPFDLHNEFSPSRSNVEGTIAMAKTGLGPHTATSEWFINL
jgi:hypothetical protein